MIESNPKLRTEAVPADLTALVERCRKGDGDAWGRLVESLQGVVYSVPKRFGLSDDDCADVFQSTFLALHTNLDRIHSGEALPKWVSVTAARESLRLRRALSKTSPAGGDGEPDLESLLRTEEGEIEAIAVKADLAYRVRLGLGRLGRECRELLEALFSEHETPYQQISDALGIPVGAIGPKRGRCLEKLRAILKKEGFFP